MAKDSMPKIKKILKRIRFWFLFSVLFFILGSILFQIGLLKPQIIYYSRNEKIIENKEEIQIPKIPPLDKEDYDRRMRRLANIEEIASVAIEGAKNVVDNKNIELNISTKSKTQVVGQTLWPVNTVYPNDGAILPFYRIVSYYGNLYSKKMGALGEYPEDEMLERLMVEVKKWNNADPETPVLPALHYIAITAQGSKGEDGKYRLRMPEKEIDKVLAMAKKIDAIVFLDLQVGLSRLEDEIPIYEKYFKMPQVHLGIDPEFSMKTGARPGTVIGTFDASDINYAAEYLAKIVKENNLTPKILIVHRFTQKMVTNYKNIKPLPEVQIVMDMDGWGGQAHKISTFKQFIFKEPVQFAGFKLFYKNDTLKPNSFLMEPEEVLKITPRPIYIQYQ